MKVNSVLVVTWIILIAGSVRIIAQNTGTKPLIDVLNALEKRYDVVFTYADESLHDISVSIPQKKLNLDEHLELLRQQTQLVFKKLDSRYIAIQYNPQKIKVSGTIINKSTKEPIDGALIYTGNSYAVSNDNGKFLLKTRYKNAQLITVRHTAFKTLNQKLIINNKKDLLIELLPNINYIEEILVPYIEKGIEKQRDGYILLSMKELELLPGLSEPDILHAVQVLPGIESSNETVSNINTRGGTNDQSLVLWDGVKMYQTGHFFGLISAFNSHLIHKTKIIKNGTGADYDEGISGTIDMQLQDFKVNKFEGSVGLNMLGADVVIKTPLTKKLSLIASGRHSINQIVTTPTYENYYKRAFQHTEAFQGQNSTDTIIDKSHRFSFYDISGKLIYDITKKDKVCLSLLHIYNTIEYEESSLARDTIYHKRTKLDQSSLLSNFVYTRSWTDKHITQFSAFVSNYLLEGQNTSEFEKLDHQQKNEVVDWGLRLDSKNDLTNTVTLSSGYQFKEVGILNIDNLKSPGYYRDAKDVLLIHSVYAEAKIKRLLKRLYLRTGLRVNYYPKFNEFSLEPRAVLNFMLTEHVSLEALGELKSQHTTQLVDYQTDFLGIEKRRWVLSNNTSIPLLKSQQFSLGAQYNKNNFLILIEGYYKKVRGIISPSQGFQNQFQYVYSAGEYQTQGLEVLLNKRFEKLNTWANYTFAINDYYFQDFSPSIFPNNIDIRHSVSLGASYSLDRLKFSAGLNYKTGKPYTEPSSEGLDGQNEITYQAPNSCRLDDYFRLDASIKYKFNIKKVKGELGVSVWNILNRKNDINTYYLSNNNNEINKITQYALGVTPNASLRLNF